MIGYYGDVIGYCGDVIGYYGDVLHYSLTKDYERRPSFKNLLVSKVAAVLLVELVVDLLYIMDQ